MASGCVNALETGQIGAGDFTRQKFMPRSATNAVMQSTPSRLLHKSEGDDWEEETMDHTMNTVPLTVTHPVTVDLIDASGSATPIEAELHYDPADPFAVTTVFKTAGHHVRWTFARELLTEGLYEPAGDGDVHVWPCLDTDGHAVVIIELCSPDGEALVQARTGDMHTFVDLMSALVPSGRESGLVDVDAAIAAIFTAENA